MPQGFFILQSPPTASSALQHNFVPRISSQWRTSSMDGYSATRLHYSEATCGGTVHVPLDELDHYFAMPFAVVITPDKSKIYVSISGNDSVTVISVQRLLKLRRTASGGFANDLSASANYVSGRIPVGRNPRGMSLSPDGKSLYVAKPDGRHHNCCRHEYRFFGQGDRYGRIQNNQCSTPGRANLPFGTLCLPRAIQLRQLPY